MYVGQTTAAAAEVSRTSATHVGLFSGLIRVCRSEVLWASVIVPPEICRKRQTLGSVRLLVTSPYGSCGNSKVIACGGVPSRVTFPRREKNFNTNSAKD